MRGEAGHEGVQGLRDGTDLIGGEGLFGEEQTAAGTDLTEQEERAQVLQDGARDRVGDAGAGGE